MSLVIGLASLGNLFGTTLDYFDVEFWSQAGRRSRMRVPWKFPPSGDPLAMNGDRALHKEQGQVRFDVEQLGGYFYRLHDTMTSSRSSTSTSGHVGQPTLSSVYSDHYSGLSLAGLLRLAKDTVMTDWERCSMHLVDKIAGNRLYRIQTNVLHELMNGIRMSSELEPSREELQLAAHVSAGLGSTPGILALR